MSSNDEKILKALGDLQAEVTAIKDVQQKQGKRFDTLETGQKALEAGQRTLETGQKTLETGQQTLQADVMVIKGVQNKQGSQLDTLELKVEAIHAYQKQAQTEIMEHLIESNEVNGQAQQQLEQEVERIKKHVGMPPGK